MSDVDVTNIENDDGAILVFAPHIEYFKAKKPLTNAFEGLSFEVDEIQFVSDNTAPLTADEAVEMFGKFQDMLNDHL